MSKRLPKLYVEDILTSIEKIEEYTNNLSFENFSSNQMIIDAVVRNLEIIGEAARNIPESFTDKYSELPWSSMVTMRNKVIHEYFGVDHDILWKTIAEDLPKLKEQIKQIPDL